MNKNWLGQEINVGDLVYNARREGNGTIQRIGVVMKITNKQSLDWRGDPVGEMYLVYHVDWTFELGTTWIDVGSDRIWREGARKPWYKKRLGQNTINSLVKLDRAAIDLQRIDDEESD